jgi:hypothetical protein
MSKSRTIGVVALWLASLLLTAEWASARAQSNSLTPSIAGNDIGIMLHGGAKTEVGVPIGSLVIRLEGKWVPVRIENQTLPSGSGSRIVPLTH